MIDPLHTEAATMATRHVAAAPGTDVYLLGHLLRQLLADGVDRQKLARRVDGLDRLQAAVEVLGVNTCAKATGVESQVLCDLVQAVRDAGRIAVLSGTGVTMSSSANVVEWLRWVTSPVVVGFRP